MAFNVEVIFTGLGMVLLRSDEKRPRKPRGVELLMLSSAGHHRHVPRLSFLVEDLARPQGENIDLHVAADGSPLVQKELTGQNLTLKVEGTPADFDIAWAEDASAVEPGPQAPENALDWIPSAVDHYGLQEIIFPEDPEAQKVYVTRIVLEPGRLSSRKLLLDSDGSIARWNFTRNGREVTAERVLAEQVVWSREGVDTLTVPLVEGGETISYVFDSDLCEKRGEASPVITLAMTNLPDDGETGRFRDPEHFGAFRHLDRQNNRRPAKLVRAPRAGLPSVTLGGSCPPSRFP
jgi:hypothetical protein